MKQLARRVSRGFPFTAQLRSFAQGARFTRNALRFTSEFNVRSVREFGLSQHAVELRFEYARQELNGRFVEYLTLLTGVNVGSQGFMWLEGMGKRYFLYESSNAYLEKYLGRHSVAPLLRPATAVRFAKPVFVLNCPLQENYYHFVCDVLLRLVAVRRAFGSEFVVLFFRTGRRFHEEYLKLLAGHYGVEVIVRDPDEIIHIETETVVVPPLKRRVERFTASAYPTNLLSALRSDVLVASDQGPDDASGRGEDAILVSRSGSARRLLNEKAIMAALPRLKRVQLEDFSVREQIRLFHDARLIIAPHGAGNTNLLFSEPGTTLIELIPVREAAPARYTSDCYSFLGDLVGANYEALTGAARSDFDFVVNVPEVVATVQHRGLGALTGAGAGRRGRNDEPAP